MVRLNLLQNIKLSLWCALGMVLFHGLKLTATNCPGVTLTFSIVTTDPGCNLNNGVIEITSVSGGSGAYTFGLNGGSQQVLAGPPFLIQNLVSGAYFLTISDGACDTTVSINLASSVGGISGVSSLITPTSCTANTGAIAITPLPAGVVVSNFLLNTGATNANGVFQSLGAGSYSVVLTDPNNCTFVANNLTIQTPASPTDMVVTVNDPECQGAKGSLEVSGIVGGTPPYKISLNGSAFSSALTYPNLLPGSYLVTLKDNNGCVLSKTVIVSPGGVVSKNCSAGDDLIINFGENVELKGVADAGAEVRWSPGVFLSDSTIQNPTAFPSSTTVFTLSTVSPEGCECKDKMTVRVIPLIDAPNTFTPNGDGVNDTWVIKYVGFFEGVKLFIYNRYGEKVYSEKNYESGKEWDGKFNGADVAPATYYYVLVFKFEGDERDYSYTGSLTVIR